jgi:hypothetical protein
VGEDQRPKTKDQGDALLSTTFTFQNTVSSLKLSVHIQTRAHAVYSSVRHGATREILTACKKVTDAASYTCILCEGVSAKGLIRVEGDLVIIPKDLAIVYISESQHRRKKFQNLKQLETYYITSRAIQPASARLARRGVLFVCRIMSRQGLRFGTLRRVP